MTRDLGVVVALMRIDARFAATTTLRSTRGGRDRGVSDKPGIDEGWGDGAMTAMGPVGRDETVP
jgi:hypothetical protein